MKYKIVLWENPYNKNKFFDVSNTYMTIDKEFYDEEPTIEQVKEFCKQSLDALPSKKDFESIKLEKDFIESKDMAMEKEGNATVLKSFKVGTMLNCNYGCLSNDIDINVSVVQVIGDHIGNSDISYKELFQIDLSDIMIGSVDTSINDTKVFSMEESSAEILFELNFGIDFDTFEQNAKKEGIEVEFLYNDEVFVCQECGLLDRNSDAYATNYRWTEDEEGNQLLVGINCGCYDKLSKANIKSFVNNTDKPITKELANDLELEGVIERLESACCTMYEYGNKTPDEILKEVHKNVEEGHITLNEGDGVVFSLDEVAQFGVCYTAYIYREEAFMELHG